MIKQTVLKLLSYLPWEELLDLLRLIAERKISKQTLGAIENLVALAEDSHMSGPEKFDWIIEQLGVTANRHIRWAIESAVLRLKK